VSTVASVGVAASHLSELAVSTDSEQVKVTINQLTDLLSPASPGVFSPVSNEYIVICFIGKLTCCVRVLDQKLIIYSYSSCFLFDVCLFKELFDTVNSCDILSFLRDVRLHCCI